MEKNKKIRKTILGFIFIISLLLFYNHKRTLAWYDFGIKSKEITFNFIPFKNILETISINPLNIIMKIIFFSIIGGTYYLINNKNKYNIVFFTIFVIVFTDVINLIFGYTSIIDINNWIIYTIGVLLGYKLSEIIFNFIKNKISINVIYKK